MRDKNFEAKLKAARQTPDLMGALIRMGYALKRVGHGQRYNCTEYKLTNIKGVSGDYSSLVFCENHDGTWRVLDNKQRYGRLAYDAIGCLTDFFGLSFDDAVYALSDGVTSLVQDRTRIVKDDISLPFSEKEPFQLPAKTEGKYSALFAYLCSRGISNELIRTLVENELLYQTYMKTKDGKLIKTKNGMPIPTIVFPIYDKNGKAVGADSCGTYNFKDFRYKHIYSGSNPTYGWRFANHTTEVNRRTPIFYCESPIDAMSLCLLTGYEGVYVSMSGCKDITFEGMAGAYGGVSVICVDNDEAGEKFLSRHKGIAYLKPKYGKDWNDDLKHVKNTNCAHVSTIQ